MVEFADKRRRFIWPKDGPQGRSGDRGFFGGMKDIMTGRGPDIFVQTGRSRPIKPDRWQNWDAYNDFNYHQLEQAGSFARRGFKRYDPHSRKYETWHQPSDWNGFGAWRNGMPFGTYGNGEGYPRFTEREWRRMDRTLRRGQQINPQKMGSEWNTQGPMRHQQMYNWFWQEAHRVGENHRQGYLPGADINPFFRPHQRWANDLNWWIYQNR